MARKGSKNELDDIYSLMADAYNGNWKFRWGSTPYFDTAKTGRTESVVSHEWACAFFWLNLRRACPALGKVVDSTKVYEILLSHDLGETHLGDVSRFEQLNGHGQNKNIAEREAVLSMTSNLGAKTREEILSWFTQFEKEPEEMTDLEVLVAKFVDSLQGDHFAMTFGHDLPSYSEPISKIINKHFVPYARKLLATLEKLGHSDARRKVQKNFDHHIDMIRAAGIRIQVED